MLSAAASAQIDNLTPLYEQDKYAIYPSSPYWCSTSNTKYSDNIELNILYDVENDKRDTLIFGGNTNQDYTRFFNKVISPIIANHCPHYSGFSPSANLRFNNKEDWKKHNGRYWDRLTFSYVIRKKSQAGKIAVSYKGQLTGRYLSAEALAKQKQDKNLIATQAAENRSEAKKQGHPFKALAGGGYLDTIYTGDFIAQNEVAWYYLSKIKKSNQNDAAMGVFLSMLGSTFSTTKKDMTVLEEISMYYLARSGERRPSDCFDPGAIKRTFTYNYPEIVYEDGYRIPASQLKSEYTINPQFIPLCDRLCEKQGVLYAVANGINAGMKRLEIADLYRGIDEMIQHYSCRSPEIKRFEANLIKYNEKELNQPSNIRRNTFKTVLEAPESTYIPYALQPHSAIADKFMADNAKNPNVVTTLSGLQYIMLTQGHGRQPSPGDIVNIYYKGTLENGRVIAKKYATGTPSTISTNGLIKGMSEAVLLLKPGGRIKVFVPPHLGFGDSANGVINKDSILIYEIELAPSINSPSHISEPARIVPTKTLKKLTGNTRKRTSFTTQPQQKPPSQVRKPVSAIIQSAKNTQPDKKTLYLASEDLEITNNFKFPVDITLNSVLVDFLAVKLASDQLDNNSWWTMLSSRWRYEKSELSPMGGHFFHPTAQQFSNDDLENTLIHFKNWMLEQSNKLPEIIYIPASVMVAKVGNTTHAVPADGCAILDDKKNLRPHQSKLTKALSQSLLPKMQSCQQRIKTNSDDLMSCVMAHQSDPSFCGQQIKNKLTKCLAESPQNHTDTWNKINVKWVQSNFSIAQCNAYLRHEKLRTSKRFPTDNGSLQFKPSQITARFNFGQSFSLPSIKDKPFNLERPLEQAILMFKVKILSGKLSSVLTKKGPTLQVKTKIISTKYTKGTTYGLKPIRGASS